VLTIAGSDPSGGAGIQADLRVFSALGVSGLSAITAITVQNTQGVRSVHPTQASVLFAQIEALLEDSTVSAVKIGMLAGEDQVDAVVRALKRFRPPNVVLDPILASSGGVPLLDEAGRRAMLRDLVPLCDLVTPNQQELTSVLGAHTDGVDDEKPIQHWFGRGARALLVKGGHLPGDPVDCLYRASDPSRPPDYVKEPPFQAARIKTVHTHGTGCFLSSAIAACLAKGMALASAISNAKKVLTSALTVPVIAGSGRGYPDVLEAMRMVRKWQGADVSMHAVAQYAMAGRLYVITDSKLRPNRSIDEIVVEALKGGAGIIQLREKGMGTRELLPLARRIGAACSRARALFIVNDRVDIALAANADGVHLGPDDMHPRDAREILGPDKLIGVSAGTVEEAIELAPYASYIGVGAIFGSKTKLDAGAPVGPERIREIKEAISATTCPIVAIGGINEENIAEVAEAGADSAAVVSAVINAEDMRAATTKLRSLFQMAYGRRAETAIGESGAESGATESDSLNDLTSR
jgi:hydroxymethylpyrimidine kinase/phosphomethylpyrimidine kinase/thiamine-phosphate diphosphorylase